MWALPKHPGTELSIFTHSSLPIPQETFFNLFPSLAAVVALFLGDSCSPLAASWGGETRIRIDTRRWLEVCLLGSKHV